MQKLKINIKSKEGTGSFEINLKLTSLWGIEGNWSCLPGNMKITGGYFDLIEKTLMFWDRERTFSEDLSYAFLNSENPIKLYMGLKGFGDSPTVGAGGEGSAYMLGANAKGNFLDKFGFVSSDIVWKVKQVI